MTFVGPWSFVVAILFGRDAEVLRGWVVMSEMDGAFLFLDSRTGAEEIPGLETP